MPPTITPPRVAPPIASRRKPGGRGSWKTALVVDPDADNRKRVIRLLREAAGEPTESSDASKPEQRLAIHEAENGSAAWALVEVVKPDLVVAEILLEGLSGLQLLRRLRDKYGK